MFIELLSESLFTASRVDQPGISQTEAERRQEPVSLRAALERPRRRALGAGISAALAGVLAAGFLL